MIMLAVGSSADKKYAYDNKYHRHIFKCIMYSIWELFSPIFC